jgi:hypothetical protein
VIYKLILFFISREFVVIKLKIISLVKPVAFKNISLNIKEVNATLSIGILKNCNAQNNSFTI